MGRAHVSQRHSSVSGSRRYVTPVERREILQYMYCGDPELLWRDARYFSTCTAGIQSDCGETVEYFSTCTAGFQSYCGETRDTSVCVLRGSGAEENMERSGETSVLVHLRDLWLLRN